MDPGAKQAEDPSLLKWADWIEYLEVHIFPRVQYFCKLNPIPLLQVFQTKLKAWANLSLTLTGRINLITIKLLPPYSM